MLYADKIIAAAIHHKLGLVQDLPGSSVYILTEVYDDVVRVSGSRRAAAFTPAEYELLKQKVGPEKPWGVK